MLRLEVWHLRLEYAPCHESWTVGAYQKAYTTAAPQFLYVSTPHYIDIAFTRDVHASLQSGDFVILKREFDLSTHTLPEESEAVSLEPGVEFQYDSYDLASNVARVRILSGGGLLPSGRYTFKIKSGAISDSLGNPLDTTDDLPFLFLISDFNNDGVVNFDDLLILGQSYGYTYSQMISFGQGDANHDGTVNFDDLLDVAQDYGLFLPP